MMSLSHPLFTHLSRYRSPMVSRSLVVGLLATLGLLSGAVPKLGAQSPAAMFSNAAYAQTTTTTAVSNEEVRNYARSLLSIEPIRLTAYEEIKRISGSDRVPAIACHQPDSLNNLNRNIREIAVNYCTQAISIVASNNLSIGRFNTITSLLQNDRALASRIQDELVRLQQASARR